MCPPNCPRLSSFSFQDADEGIHPFVRKMLAQGKPVLVGGLVGEVRAVVDHLLGRLDLIVQKLPMDLWVPGRPENRPYRVMRQSMVLLSVPKIGFAVCFCPLGPGLSGLLGVSATVGGLWNIPVSQGRLTLSMLVPVSGAIALAVMGSRLVERLSLFLALCPVPRSRGK